MGYSHSHVIRLRPHELGPAWLALELIALQNLPISLE